MQSEISEQSMKRVPKFDQDIADHSSQELPEPRSESNHSRMSFQEQVKEADEAISKIEAEF